MQAPYFTAILILTVFSGMAGARDYFVAITGSDTNAGTRAAPFRTIQRAADVLEPGDSCIIRAGVYREWVKPPRGGDGEARRIIYRSDSGERVIIQGSEPMRSWRERGSVWTAELPDGFFGAFNPFKLNLSGDWLHYGKELHRGSVYLNGERLLEKLSPEEVRTNIGTFCIVPGSQVTVLNANFGKHDPNRELTEVDVRECNFFPAVQGLGYITIDGLEFAHASANWAAWRQAQRGAVGTGWGYRWVIQNCVIRDARCVGLVCGNEASGENEGFDLRQVGGHIVRNNHIFRCGQAGIHGFKGWAGSLLESNLIEDINVAREFGGEETGGIKVHSPVDITIRNNILRRIYSRPCPGRNTDFVAIWIDWAGQGTRVTGNIVYDCEAWALYLQNNHGSPIVVDNNVFSGTIATSSEGCVFAHNLFIHSPWRQLKRYALVSYWKPHSAELAGLAIVTNRNDSYFKNVFVGQGIDNFPQAPGTRSDYNAFYSGARPTAWGDSASIVAPEIVAEVDFKSLPGGVAIGLRLGEAPRASNGPLVGPELIGEFALTGQGLENPNGTPLRMDEDLTGRRRKEGVAGPFATLPRTIRFQMNAGPKKRSGSS